MPVSKGLRELGRLEPVAHLPQPLERIRLRLPHLKPCRPAARDARIHHATRDLAAQQLDALLLCLGLLFSELSLRLLCRLVVRLELGPAVYSPEENTKLRTSIFSSQEREQLLETCKALSVLKQWLSAVPAFINPLACAVAKSALEVVLDEKLAENAFELGNYFRDEMNKFIEECSVVSLVRGKGLLNAIVINDSPESLRFRNICL